MCRNAAVGAGGQTGTEAWRRQRPTLNNQAASKMLGLQNRSPNNDLGYAGHSAEQRPSYHLTDRHFCGTRTPVLFRTAIMHASIDGRLTTSLYSHCRYSGRVVSAVLENVLGTRFESQRRINQPTTLTRQCAGMPPSVQAAKPGLRRGAVNGQR